MPHTKTALLLMMALTLPGAARALGLGEIHVDSALNEPLAAEIDIVGATADDLAGITASIANSETFQRFGADRPGFLSSAKFKIATDGKGQPVLAIRSREAFTEPLIDLLIDVRWHSGELVRQYTLLLDPPSFAPAARLAEDSKPAQQPVSNAPPTRPAVSPTASPETVKVVPGSTLHGIASRLASSDGAGLQRTMIAIFRANPSAFEGNLNRLRVGAELTMPSASEISAISTADADHVVHSQMESWHSATKITGPATPAALGSADVRAAAPARAPADASSAVADADEAALNLRVQDLEKELKDVKGVLERQNDTLVDLRARAARAGTTQAATALLPVAKPGHAAAGPWITAALALALGAMGVLYGWMRSRTPNPEVSPADAQKQNLGSAPPVANLAVNHQVSAPVPALETQTQPRPMPAETPLEATAEQPRRAAVDAPADEHATLVAAVLDGIDLETLDASYRLEAGGSLEQTVNLNTAETANLPAATMKIRVSDSNAETLPLATPRLVTAVPEPAMPADTLNADTAKLQYKSIDVDGAEHHIQMPSILREKGAFKDRRTSLVDVLKVAVEREPSRRDLRMKLLETFYAAAAVNRQGFLEVAQYLAGERGNMPNGEWEKIAGMGRQIAADSDLFAANTDPADDTDLVNCA